MDSELPGVEVIVVANREPYIHNSGNGGSAANSGKWARLRARTYHACMSGHLDRTRPAEQRTGKPSLRTNRIARTAGWARSTRFAGYGSPRPNKTATTMALPTRGYGPCAISHLLGQRFRLSDWENYRSINSRFAADAVVREARTESPIVLVQDYHFACCRACCENDCECDDYYVLAYTLAQLRNLRHLSWKEELVAWASWEHDHRVHTQFHCNNFLETVDRFVESRIDREQRTVILGGHETFVRAYPISIEWPPRLAQGSAYNREIQLELSGSGWDCPKTAKLPLASRFRLHERCARSPGGVG